MREPVAKAPKQITSDGSWHALARVRGVDNVCHQFHDDLDNTRCGLMGRRIGIPAGATVRPCNKCWKNPIDLPPEKRAAYDEGWSTGLLLRAVPIIERPDA